VGCPSLCTPSPVFPLTSPLGVGFGWGSVVQIKFWEIFGFRKRVFPNKKLFFQKKFNNI